METSFLSLCCPVAGREDHGLDGESLVGQMVDEPVGVAPLTGHPRHPLHQEATCLPAAHGRLASLPLPAPQVRGGDGRLARPQLSSYEPLIL